MNANFRTLLDCCGALAATPPRLARPRRPDKRLLAHLAGAASDAPAPAPRATVTLTPLVQARQTAPTLAIAEGAMRPPLLTLGMTTFLVEHPSARFLVDPAMCADVHRRVLPELPPLFRTVVAPDRPVIGLAEALRQAGIAPSDIDFALPTHMHWDHVSGLADLPADLPVRVLEAERSFALAADPATGRPPLGCAHGPLTGRTFVPYELDGPALMTFTRSHDLFGDGSVVIVDLAGHTPGSVGVLLAVADSPRILLAGDAAWHRLQIDLLREKAPFPGRLVDADRDAAFATLHRLHALPSAVEVIPSHDRAAALALAGKC
ncbi:MBL fold metallo-hydrolase [Streptomyces sp. RB6PN25]|uniref:MBL fold metallo-hydrolase n=1 Tax=Streptomyces humicola TaxID=2953240 RepID=A0ABT1PYY0_9ACTN|nr:MBL fold metallo-hydrolase [Streptomyces humicola]MCQ4082328.1 MBL fold metallo-hydrolase [Streptomyces humicola]